MRFTVHRNIAAVLTSSYHFIKPLIDLISEAGRQVVEPGYLSGCPPDAKFNDSGGHFLLLHCLQRSDNYETKREESVRKNC